MSQDLSELALFCVRHEAIEIREVDILSNLAYTCGRYLFNPADDSLGG